MPPGTVWLAYLLAASWDVVRFTVAVMVRLLRAGTVTVVALSVRTRTRLLEPGRLMSPPSSL